MRAGLLAVPAALALAVGLAQPPAAAAVTSWPDEPGDAAPAADITAYSIGVFGDHTGGSVRLAAYDPATVAQLVVSVSLDVDGDGTADFVLWKYGRPGPVEVVRESDAETVCTDGFAAYDAAGSTVSVYAPSRCLGSPASARGQLYVGGRLVSAGAADFAPSADELSPAVAVGATSPVQPPPPPSPAPSPTPAPPSPSPAPTPPGPQPAPPAGPARVAPKAQATVAYSRGVATVCVVARDGSAGLRGERARLLTKPPRSGTWRPARTYVLNRAGRACVTQPAVRVWQYRWRVLASPAVVPATSNTVRVEPRR
ncbi:hypothetical protein [Motilibacter aurantiacus]|uniref:hypothetical protein n=1 Tax=Motilibacter aurantiacus TaxID=2714955 RepID=UPI00140D31E9|nr:hypothetical protein [Motilibacter aurantiacus]NHC43678.1 hypothetical protein [Motilibacter aurantiacus]